VTGDRISGGYEAGFVISERAREAVEAELARTTWEKSYTVRMFGYPTMGYDKMGLVRAKVRPGIGFGGTPGYVVVAQTRGEEEFVRKAVNRALRTLFKEGDRVATLAPLRRWYTADDRPVGTLATVTRLDSGGLYIEWDEEPGKEYTGGAHWFEVVAN